MKNIGTLEELPQEYLESLESENLVPLWPSLKALLPPRIPTTQTQAIHWTYKAIRPLLMKAGELTPIEKAERRVLVLANPGHGLNAMKVSPAMYVGMQLLLPGEWAPSHRHTPNAVRMIVEGEGAFTTVEGEKCPMSRGDLILTPSGLWHEHSHEGDKPVVWLDVLDLPLIYYMETSYTLTVPNKLLNQVAVIVSMPMEGFYLHQYFRAMKAAILCCAIHGRRFGQRYSHLIKRMLK